MKWLAIIQLILDIIKQLPFDATAEQVEAKTHEVLQSADDVQVAQDADAQDVTIPVQDWEEIIPHIIAIVLFFLRRRT